MTMLDKVKRWAALRVLNAIGYEGATVGRRGDGWKARSGAADDVGWNTLQRLRDRSRHMCRNHWAASRASDVLTAHIVGAGILPSCLDDKLFDKLLDEWAKPQSQVGTQKGHSLGAVQRLVCRTVIESGSCLVVRQWRTAKQMRERGLIMPFQLSVLEPEYLDSGRDGRYGNNQIVGGIEYDSTDWPVAYWLHTRHPGSVLRLAEANSVRVDANEVAHVYWQRRAGQTIGVPWYAPVLLKMRDFDEYEGAQLLRQKIASFFAAFVRGTEWDGTVGGTDDDDPLNDIELEPGRVQYLEPGEEVTFSTPPSVDGYGEYSSITLRSIAAGLGTSYEALAGDYSRTNFSSARMGSLIERVLTDQWQHEMMIGQLCQSLDLWIMQGAALLGIPTHDCQTRWTPPRRELLDPSREVGAIERSIAAGLTSRQYEIRRLGRDAVDVDRERQQDAERERELGLASEATDENGEALAHIVEDTLREVRLLQ